MYTIKLMNEFLHGPIWVYDDEGFIRRKFALIDSDEELQTLNEEAKQLYDSCYSFDDGNEACKFDEEKYKQNYTQMISIIEKIMARLDIINDGSFCVKNFIKLQ